MTSIIDIAENIKNELNNAVWSVDFTAKREFKPVYNIEDISGLGLQVDVVPRVFELNAATRMSTWQNDEIDIGIAQKLEEAIEEQVQKDELVRLAESIARFFFQSKIDGAIIHGAVYSPLYLPEKLRKEHVFFGLITLSVKVLESSE